MYPGRLVITNQHKGDLSGGFAFPDQNTTGQIANLPDETVAETNALFSYNDVRPVMAGPLKPEIHALILPHAENFFFRQEGFQPEG